MMMRLFSYATLLRKYSLEKNLVPTVPYRLVKNDFSKSPKNDEFILNCVIVLTDNLYI